MNEQCSREQIAELVMQLGNILAVLDNSNARLAAIKVDEAISALCEEHDICRSDENVLDIKSG
ncbi:hypothetical protein SAMN02745824_1161 [Parasphingorhabdus marina DSM 22363]|uniref:Uncharacterized protein n=1 Tax=Parasphingorhabdus marina DSM 22363 TaxID=1123272 RepID=A0A1N6CWY1_9SPHN|nr:hypothetical protein [Parasphingorhabdus marina]SIN62997.1 hypothetical protein SAMN02745824_1161 [Parasphingorhabdus marina DSM 22363]